MDRIQTLLDNIDSIRKEVLEHALYKHIHQVEDVNRFMEAHVYAVWDFMSLLKALQIKLTCTTVPWIPKGNPMTRKLINEIVLGEETDISMDGRPASHFELYLEAMRETGAETKKVEQFIHAIEQGSSLESSLKAVGLAREIADFINFTFEIIASDKLHCIAAVFAFGREDLIPDLFTSIIKDLNQDISVNLSKLLYYLERHVELDSDEHGPMAMQMIEEICGDDDKKWEEATEASLRALQQRKSLWDYIVNVIREQNTLVAE
ncbi:DUF3050 domain-containing protein [Rapidithrix thailandica]|uniref:DUF3050 domain-containing protein n=1 Tax=Rapidithrix thailandica TaxID=413964 RepID=A0AAW9S997_9BACT